MCVKHLQIESDLFPEHVKSKQQEEPGQGTRDSLLLYYFVCVFILIVV